MTRRFPPLNSLRAFEAAGRHLSFKKAAEELHVTPAAISQQVRALEEFHGIRLFDRLTRALRLTDPGRAALPMLTEGFDRLAAAVGAMEQAEQSGILTISVAPSFGAKWLVPRLERFRAAHPEFDVRLDATDAIVDFTRDDVDLAIRYGRGTYRNLVSELLMGEVSFPVCSPALLERGPPIVRPDDLRHHTLLHTQWKMENEAAPNWRMWLRAAGVDDIDAERGPRFSVDSMAIDAAIAGQGVVLASGAIAEDDLAAGRLIRPFPPSVCESTAFSYFLVYPQARIKDPKVATFRQWVLSEVTRPTPPA